MKKQSLYEIYLDFKSMTNEKSRLKDIYETAWDTLSRERKSRLIEAIQAANQSIAIVRNSLIGRRVKVNREMPFSHFFYIDTVGEILDVEGNRVLFRAEGMSEEHGLAWLSVLCLDFIEEVAA